MTDFFYIPPGEPEVQVKQTGRIWRGDVWNVKVTHHITRGPEATVVGTKERADKIARKLLAEYLDSLHERIRRHQEAFTLTPEDLKGD